MRIEDVDGRFVNCTQHVVRLIREGQETLVLPPCEHPARVTYKQVGEFIGVDIVQRVGSVQGLPGPVPGTMYIASRMVKNAVPTRTDVVVPAQLVKDPSSGELAARRVAL